MFVGLVAYLTSFGEFESFISYLLFQVLCCFLLFTILQTSLSGPFCHPKALQNKPQVAKSLPLRSLQGSLFRIALFAFRKCPGWKRNL